MIRRLERFLTTKHVLIGTSWLRIFFGAGILFYLLSHYSERHLLWGADGLWPYQQFLAGSEKREIWTLYHLSSSPIAFEVIFHGTLFVTLLWTIGWHTRLTGVLTFLCFWSLYYRNPFITNGGDNIVRLQLLYLLFADLGARFSVDRWRKRRRQTAPSPWLEKIRPYAAVLHNAAVAMAIVQVMLMYFTAGLYKVMGSMWQNGTAIYYAMRVQEFAWPGYSEKLWASETLVVLLTYTSVLFQVAFPFLLLNRYTKYAAVCGAILFHLGIGVFMNLALFSWFMIGIELILLTDKDYRRLSHLLGRAGRWMRRRLSWIGDQPFFARRRVTVFYDGWCSFCQASVDSARRLDLFGLLRFVSFREKGVPERYGLDPVKLEQRLHSTADGHTFYDGIDGIIQMITRLPLLWPTLPGLWLARILGIGQRVYDWIAARRTIIPAGGCDDHCRVEYRPESAEGK
ncbi:hypothetical protein GCM10011571_30780 [Marinithermofilum abyssi]|uniref:HTTM-like domain-containing protein n=1 Tax=Marinithermofilum abyssi TaxID=1571185 RepID=A0A8J2VJM5_9BACL|nr:DCC1-like thiol-disulfide oxidoreductase family protein [Marinithermofilum abyssi]GGE26428.1 hypothetical protein GCM10011571_30780 [Marinithermofilum abyssi]